MALEGVVSKRGDRPYRSGRTHDWLKSKCGSRQEFVITGFTLPSKAGANGIGALALGYYEGERLVYAGRVGTGFTDEIRRHLRAELEKRRISRPVMADLSAAARRGVHWVRPELTCEVEFTEWTTDGMLRHPSYQGLREDKDPQSIRRERPAAAAK